MRKKSFVLILLLILCTQLVYSETIEIVINEGDTLDITEKVQIFDPDNDKINIRFTEPLDQSGIWKTSYSDSGNYYANITVSDGKTKLVQPILIIVKNVNRKPIIASFNPEKYNLTINELECLNFSVSAKDADNDKLYLSWTIDKEEFSTRKESTYCTTYFSAGTHEIKITVSDGETKSSKEWIVNVLNTNSPPSLNYLEDLYFYEGNNVTIILNASDIDNDTITYSISNPIGDDNNWVTGFDDAGEYSVTIIASDGFVNTSKNIKLTIRDKDRIPIITSFFPEDDRLNINEGESISFNISAFDPDSEDNVDITWKKNNKEVGKGKNFIFSTDFRSAGANTVEAIVSDGAVSISKDWLAIVKDVNQPPFFNTLEDVYVKEGDKVILKVNTSDPDKDIVTVSFSKPFSKDGIWKTGFDDASTYFVTVIASDGELSSFDVVKVIVGNFDRPLVFRDVEPVIVVEGEQLKFRPSVYDLDDEPVTITAYNLPNESTFDGKELVWTPNFDVAKRNTDWFGKSLAKLHVYNWFFSDSEKFFVTFNANSNNVSVNRTLTIIVKNKNLAPSFSGVNDVYHVLESETVFVNASTFDPDSDAVSISFDKPLNKKGEWLTYFTDSGTYNSSITVSDGDLVVSKNFKIDVINNNRAPTIYIDNELKFDGGDVVKLNPQVSDPDEDNITTSYSGWMKNSERNTTENDSGIFNVTISAFDGKNTTKKVVTVILKKPFKIDYSVLWFYTKYVLLGIIILIVLILFINWFEKKNAKEKVKREAKERLGRNRFEKVRELMNIK